MPVVRSSVFVNQCSKNHSSEEEKTYQHDKDPLNIAQLYLGMLGRAVKPFQVSEAQIFSATNSLFSEFRGGLAIEEPPNTSIWIIM